jgi:hypothetical protein
MYHNSRSNSYGSKRGSSYNRGRSAQYVWRVSWRDHYGNFRNKAFTNKQHAMIFMTKLKNGKNILIDLEKWYGN